MPDPQYLSTDPNAGTYLSTDPNAGAPVTVAPKTDDSSLGAIGRGLAGFWEQVNPVTMVSGAASAIGRPVETVKGIGRAQGQLYNDAAKAFQAGDYVTGARKAINYLIPILGPALDAQSEKAASGDVAGAVGGTLGLGAATIGPSKLVGAKVQVPAVAKPVNVVDRAAVEFGKAHGVPIDAATATGNKAVQGVQFLSDRSIGGSMVADRARQAQATALGDTGRRLASAVHPTAVAPEQAGQAVRAAIEGRVQVFDKIADVAYDRLRQVEADPASTRTVTMKIPMTDSAGVTKMESVSMPMQLPVNIKTVKAMLKPVYDRMTRQMPQTVLRASKGFKSLQNIMESYDFMPASIVDLDLSAIKELARGSDMPELRSMSQGLAAGAVRELDKAVQAAVAQGGPEAVAALKAGREATKIKYGSAGVLKDILKEPVQAFNQATWRGDAGINRLRAMQREAPSEMAKLGRAYLDDMLATATAEGGFSKAGTLASKWQQLGPQTKRILFGAAKTDSLDKFFHLAKRIGDNPNPSGSAFVGALGAQGAYTFINPVSGVALQIGMAGLSKLLRSEAGIKALTQGFEVRLGNKFAASATASQLAKLAGADAIPIGAEVPRMPAPAFSEDTRTP